MIHFDRASALAESYSSDPSYLQSHPLRLGDRATHLAVKAFFKTQRPHSSDTKQDHYDVLKPYILFLSPGAGNIFFTPSNMNALSRPFAGAVELSALPGNDLITHFGSYSRIGDDKRITIANWTKRVALAFHQMYKSWQNLKLPLGAPIRWLGHSQGGLVVLAGKAIAKIYSRLGHVPDKISKLFPGLSDLPKHELDFILPRVEAGEADAFASPLEEFSLHPSRERFKILRDVRDFISEKLIGGALHYMQKDFLLPIYDALEFGPGDLSLQMITEFDRSLSRAWQHGINCSSLLSDISLGVVNTMTIGISHLIGPHVGDGFVKKPEIHTGNLVVLEGVPASHVEQVLHPGMPTQLLNTMVAHTRASNAGVTMREFASARLPVALTPATQIAAKGRGGNYLQGRFRASRFSLPSKIFARL